MATSDGNSSSNDSLGISQVWLHLALLFGVVVLVYGISVKGVFVLDDRGTIETTTATRQLFPPAEEIPVYLHHRPVSRISLFLNYSPDPKNPNKISPVGYHITNILIHLAAAIALYFLVRDTRRLVERNPLHGGELSAERLSFTGGFAAAVACIWMVHPLTSEAVTYITQRQEALMGVFFLLTLYGLLRGATSAMSWLWYLGSLATLWLSVGSKEVGAMALPVALLFDRAFLSSAWSEVFRKRGLVYLLFLLPLGWLGYELATFNPNSKDAGLFYEGVGRWEYFSTQPLVLLRYLQLTFAPNHLVLDYGWPMAEHWYEIYPAGAVIVALLAASFYAWFKWPKIGFLALSFFFILAPTSTIVPMPDAIFEHRMYLPLTCLVTLFVMAGHYLWRKYEEMSPATEPDHIQTRRICVVLLVIAVALPLGSRTISRNLEYKSKSTLYANDLKFNPNNKRALLNTALALNLEEGKVEEVDELMTRYISLPPEKDRGAVDRERKHRSLARAYNLRGSARNALNRFDDALADWTKAIELDPKFLQPLMHRGELHSRFDRTDEALSDFSKALEISPTQPVPLLMRAEVNLKLGKLEAAEADCSQAIKAFDNIAMAYYRRGLVRAKMNKNEEALKDFDKAIELNDEFGHAYAERAKLLFAKEDYEGAWDDVQLSQEFGQQTELEFFRKLRAIVKKSGPVEVEVEENTSIAP